MSTQDAEVLQTAQEAFQSFCHGLATGQWESFLMLLSDDFTFWFPAGAMKGTHQGKAEAKAFFQYVSQIFDEGLAIELIRTLTDRNTVLFEVRSRGNMRGYPYDNQAAISFDIQDGKVCGYREYLGVIYQLPSP
jgi:ketosteroid isomerase-like protein